MEKLNIYKSSTPPKSKNAIWLDGNKLKYFEGGYKTIGGSFPQFPGNNLPNQNKLIVPSSFTGVGMMEFINSYGLNNMIFEGEEFYFDSFSDLDLKYYEGNKVLDFAGCTINSEYSDHFGTPIRWSCIEGLSLEGIIAPNLYDFNGFFPYDGSGFLNLANTQEIVGCNNHYSAFIYFTSHSCHNIHTLNLKNLDFFEFLPTYNNCLWQYTYNPDWENGDAQATFKIIGPIYNLGLGWRRLNLTNWDCNSIDVIINGLAEVTNQSEYPITLEVDRYVRIPNNLVAQAVDKGWTVSFSGNGRGSKPMPPDF